MLPPSQAAEYRRITDAGAEPRGGNAPPARLFAARCAAEARGAATDENKRNAARETTRDAIFPPRCMDARPQLLAGLFDPKNSGLCVWSQHRGFGTAYTKCLE
jgi:hypothetical protein